jgi:predicted ribosomally synthesized peptide with nif11-like leader
MTNKAVGEFFDLLDGGPELRKELQAEIERAAAAAIIGFAARRGLEFTREELDTQLTNQVADLSEEELEAVAGGVSLRPDLSPAAVVISVATAGSTSGFLPQARLPSLKKGQR